MCSPISLVVRTSYVCFWLEFRPNLKNCLIKPLRMHLVGNKKHLRTYTGPCSNNCLIVLSNSYSELPIILAILVGSYQRLNLMLNSSSSIQYYYDTNSACMFCFVCPRDYRPIPITTTVPIYMPNQQFN